MKARKVRRCLMAILSVLILIAGMFTGVSPQTAPVNALADNPEIHLRGSTVMVGGEEQILIEVIADKDFTSPKIGEYGYQIGWQPALVSWVWSESACGMESEPDPNSYDPEGGMIYFMVRNWGTMKGVTAGSVLDRHYFKTISGSPSCGDIYTIQLYGEWGVYERQQEMTEWSPEMHERIDYFIDHNWTWDTSVSPTETPTAKHIGFTWNGTEPNGPFSSTNAHYVCSRCGAKTTYNNTPVSYTEVTPALPGKTGVGRYNTWIGEKESYDHIGHTGYRDVTIPALPNETTITVTKVWQDGSNQDGIRPGSVTVGVTGGGVNKTTEITGSGNEWSTTITVPIVDGNGRQITYTAYEVNTSSGYQSSVNGLVITNTHTPEKTSVTVTKTWDDKDNQDGIRPGAVTIHLLGNGAEVTSAQLNDANGWAASFGDLPKYSGGNPISYTVTEDPVAGYTTEISGFNIVNRHTPEKTTVTVTKTWDDGGNQDGKRPESITVHLLANGSEVQTATLNEAGGWVHTFADLPKFAAGKEIAYTVTEDAVEGYQTEIKGTEIVNTYTPETTEFTVTKVWEDEDDKDGLRPESVTIHLLADGTETDQATLDETGGWTHTFADLPKYKDGKEIVYTVTEDEVTGYETEIKDGTVTNRHTLETETESESESESETESKKETESPSESETETPSAPGNDPGSSGGKSGGLFHKGAAWALINLIAMIGTVVTALGMIATVFAGRKGERVKREEEETDEEYEERKREAEKDSPFVGLKFLGLIPAIFSAIVFLLTEDMRQPMRLTDVYTILMIVVFLVGLLLAFFTRRKNRRQKKEKSLEAEEV